MQWFLFKGGICASNHFETGVFVKSDPSILHPDIQLQFLPLAMSEAGEKQATEHRYQVGR